MAQGCAGKEKDEQSEKIVSEKMLRQSDIERLPECSGLEFLLVDDKSLEMMLHIETTMQRLAVMGNDAQRMLWFEV